jgi:hypothetical protein
MCKILFYNNNNNTNNFITSVVRRRIKPHRICSIHHENKSINHHPQLTSTLCFGKILHNPNYFHRLKQLLLYMVYSLFLLQSYVAATNPRSLCWAYTCMQVNMACRNTTNLQNDELLLSKCVILYISRMFYRAFGKSMCT